MIVAGQVEMTRKVARACAALLALVAAACQDSGTVTAPALTATCEARPASGPAPLQVSFLLSVAGAEGPFTVTISYGDGTSGSNPDAPHVYQASGAFTVSFGVATATQSARCATAVTVQPGAQASPPPGGNLPPEAVFKSTPDDVRGTISGKAPLSVRFNMCASVDPERDPIFFRMDFDGDGRFDKGGTTGGHCRSDYVYAAGTWRARNCLHDVDADGQARHEDQCRTYTVEATP